MNNPFANIFSSLFATKSTSVLGIDIGASSLKIIQLKKKNGKAILETYGEIALGPYGGTNVGRSTVLGAEKIAEAIRDLLKESNTTTTSSGMSLPINSSLVTFLKMPTNDEKKLAEMIPIEARKYVPVPISEVSLDWWAIPKDESTASEYQNGQKLKEDDFGIEVLLVAISNDALNKNKDIQKSAMIDVSFSEIEIFSNIRAVLDPSLAPQMIIDFGAGSTKVFIVERGIIRTSHIINRGSQDITIAISKSMDVTFEEAEKIKRTQGILEKGNERGALEVSTLTVDYILAEANRVLLNYYSKNNKKVSKTVLSGGGAALLGLKEKAESVLGTQIEIANPFSKVEYPAFLEEVLKSAGPEFAVAIGLAIRKLQEI